MTVVVDTREIITTLPVPVLGSVPSVNVKTRVKPPTKTVFYVGPTNSGKTYSALQSLYDAYQQNPSGLYVYAGPLRMLAYEVYEKMVDRFGVENVGFITGEDQVNPKAPLLACTVEMAPKAGDMLVLDETHWVVDPDRGHNWTELLHGGEYDRFAVVTAEEALEGVAKLLEDSVETDLVTATRKTPLHFKGYTDLYSIPDRTAVVCFSRKTVYAVAHLLEEAGKKVGVLYGALPLKARESQIQKYLEGEYQVMVTTDVIGHGINLPIDNVVFVQSEKFDGSHKRDLMTWEIAQIAGRAGRYKISEEGTVSVLTGREWFTQDDRLLFEGVKAGAGVSPTDLKVDGAYTRPHLKDLNITNPNQILTALTVWQEQVSNVYPDKRILPSPLKDMKRLLYAVSDHMNAPLYPDEAGTWGLSLQDVWNVISGPFDPSSNTIPVLLDWLRTPNRHASHVLETYFLTQTLVLDQPVLDEKNLHGDQLAPLEKAAQVVGELKIINLIFGSTGSLWYSELTEFEERLSEAIKNTLHQMISKGVYGECTECHSSCSPWFRYCEECYWAQRKR